MRRQDGRQLILRAVVAAVLLNGGMSLYVIHYYSAALMKVTASYFSTSPLYSLRCSRIHAGTITPLIMIARPCAAFSNFEIGVLGGPVTTEPCVYQRRATGTTARETNNRLAEIMMAASAARWR